MQLSADSLQTIQTLRANGVLEDTKPEALQPKRSFVLLACGDGDRARELITTHVGHHCGCNDEKICSHLVMENGGALVLSKHSPLASRGGLMHDLVCIANISEACEIKKTKTVVLYNHFPCGMANANNLSVIDCLLHLIEAKDRLREEIKDVDLMTFVHVDYGFHRSGDRRSYFFNRKRFVRFLAAPSQSKVA